MRNEYGEIPLLVAIRSGSYFPVIEDLVQTRPSTLSMRNDKGRLPAHTLWTSFLSTIPGAMEVRRNVSADEHSESTDFCVGGLLKRFWEKFEYVLLETDRIECQSNGRTFNEKALCHMIIAQNFQNGHIPLLLCLRHDPNLGLQGDSNGDTPLHIEAREGNEQSISILLRKCAASASLKNNEGKIPLHFAAESNVSWDKTLYPLIQAVPDSLCWKDPTTELYPFMLAAQANDADSTFQLLRAAPYLLRCCIGTVE